VAKLGFIGVGLMGHGMAANLLKGGHDVAIVAHRNRAPVEDLVRRGAEEVKAVADLPQDREAIFVCVTNSDQVRSVVTALEPGLEGGQLIIDTGTSDPEVTVALGERLGRRGVHLVDAPMGGGAQQSEAGQLASLVGGTASDYARVEPWIRCYSALCVHMGPIGAGHRAKLLNNLLALGQAALVIEAYRMAREEGLDWRKLYEINMGGAARSGSLERIMVPALEGDYRGYLFTLENSVKDLSYIVDFAAKRAHSHQLSRAIRKFYEDAVASEGGSLMVSEMLKPKQ
jgi:3-hydroxyisobutyrate dehydrogenase-like beta-hydroxyacid dehydrogenase